MAGRLNPKNYLGFSPHSKNEKIKFIDSLFMRCNAAHKGAALLAFHHFHTHSLRWNAVMTLCVVFISLLYSFGKFFK